MKWMGFALIVAAAVVLACEGDRGPMGSQGSQGDSGATGPSGPGTRIVYESETPIPDSDAHFDAYCVAVPEITLEDMPLVMVYISPGQGYWYVAAGYQEEMWQWVEILDHKVCFFRCAGLNYRIVVVK